MFIEVPLFSETSPALKNSWLRACTEFNFAFHFSLKNNTLYKQTFLEHFSNKDLKILLKV